MVKMKQASISLAMVVLLAACGGGGDGGSSTSGGSLQITKQNYVEVSEGTVSALDAGESLGSIGAGLVVGAEITAADTVPLGVIALKQSKLMVKRWASGGDSFVVGVVVSETEACTFGGNAVYKYTDVNGNEEPDGGDSVQVTFNQCNDGEYTLNGVMSLEVDSISGDLETAPSSAVLSISFGNLVAVGQGSAAGSMKITYSLKPNSEDIKLEFSDVSIQEGSETTKLTGLVFNVSSGLQQETLTVSGKVESSSLGGSVLISTPEPIASNFNGDISSGRLVITGANGSATQLRFVNAGSAPLLELDEQGDGTFEISAPAAWWDDL